MALHYLYERLHRLYERLCNGSVTALQRLYEWLFEQLYEWLFERLHEWLYDGFTIAHTIVSVNGSVSSLLWPCIVSVTALYCLYHGSIIACTVAYNRLYDGFAMVLQ
jgi:hypothetical protein